jgi:NADH dehydrogenase FAD-containing subunit
MKSLEDAYGIRKRVLGALEEAEQTPDLEQRRLLQSVVVVGGGPTGCELAASLNDLMRHTLERDFKQIDPSHCKVTLVDPGDRVLRAMDPQLSKAAGDHLKRSGVELLLGGRVKSIEEGRLVVTTADGEVTLDTLASKLSAIAQSRQAEADTMQQRVRVRGDKGVNYGLVMQVIGELNGAGFRRIDLLSNPAN